MAYTQKIDNLFPILKKCHKQIKLLEAKQTAFDLIFPIIKSFEGKQVTKRIKTKIENELKDYSISYNPSWTYIELSIWGNGIEYNDKITFNLCLVEGDKTLSIEKVMQYPQWFDYKTNIEALREFTNNANQLVKEWNEFIELIKTKSERFKGIPYPVNEYFYLPTVY